MSIDSAWQPTPADLELDVSRIDVWRFSLHAQDTVVDDCLASLNDNEHHRADRFRIPAKRAEFILGRTVMRRALGMLLNTSPREVPIIYNPHGKPLLNVDALTTPLESPVAFNLSHAGVWGLFAVTLDRRLGIDIQDIDPRTECEKLATRFFSPNESRTLQALPEASRRDAFFRCWARKEAFLKAIGRGIALGLDNFDVSLAPDDPPALLATRFDPVESCPWQLVDIDVADGYAAAMAADRPPFTVHRMHWDWSV